MKTLYCYGAPSGRACVRLVERPKTAIAQPMIVNTSFAVILDVTAHYAMFKRFGDIEQAATYYCDAVRRVIEAETPSVSLEAVFPAGGA